MFNWYIILHIVVSLAVSYNCTKSHTKSDTSDRKQQKEEQAKKKRHEKAMKKFRRDNKKMYKSVNKKKSQLEKDLKKCPKESGGKCNCDERVCGLISYMRTEHVDLLRKEYDHSDEKENEGKDALQIAKEKEEYHKSALDRAEKASGDIYMPIVKEVMELCLQHCEEPEKLEIYVRAHEEKLKYIVECPVMYFEKNEDGVCRTSYRTNANYKNVPPPPEFWKKVKEMEEGDVIYNWGGHDGVVRAYQDGYRLMRRKAGNRLTKKREKEIQRRWEEEQEREYAEHKKEEEEKREKEEDKEREKKLAEKNGKDGVVAKAGEDKKEKSKVSQSKKIETSKEMSKEKVDEDVKKSNKSNGAEKEKNEGSKEGEEKEGSDKKDEGSKEKGSKMSKESTSKKPSAEEAK